MTRETKLGLGVGISFLSLVAVVVFNNYRKTETPTASPEPVTPVVVAQGNKDGKVPPKPEQPSALPLNFNAQAPVTPVTHTQNGGTGQGQPNSSGPQFPTAPISPTLPQPPISGMPPTPQKTGPDGPIPPVMPPLTGNTAKPDEFKGPPGSNVPIPAPINPLPPGGFEPKSIPPLDPSKTLPTQPGPVSPFPPPSNLSPSLPQNTTGPITPMPLVPEPAPVLLPNSNPAPVMPPGSGAPGFPGGSSPGPGNPGLPGGSSPSPIPPPLGYKSFPTPPGNFGPNPDLKQGGQAAPLPIQGGFPEVKSPAGPAPIPDFGKPPSSPSPIPVPNGPSAANPVPSKPQVESYNEQLYVCTAADTDFAVLSRRFYNNSDKYAQALLEYNRDHPIGKDAVRPGGQLQPNMRVFIPQQHVLEKNYGGAIQGIQPVQGIAPKNVEQFPSSPPKALVPVTDGAPTGLPTPVPPPTTGSWNPSGQGPASPPQPVAPLAGSPNNAMPQPAVPSTAAPAGAPFKVYVVKTPTPLYEIARDTLGNGTRWPEIFRLNQRLDPAQPVPAGTQLSMPPDARVGQ